MPHAQTLQEDSHSPQRVSRNVLATNLVLMTIQLTTGWLTGSNAIIADGVHSAVDLIVDAVLLASFASRLSARWLPSAVVSLLLTLTGMELVWQGLTQTTDGQGAATSVQLCALAVAMTVIVTRECVARYLASISAELADTADAHSDAAGLLAAGAWHARLDAISAGAAAVGALGTMAGFVHLDQMGTLLIGAMMGGMGLLHEGSIVRLGYRIVR